MWRMYEGYRNKLWVEYKDDGLPIDTERKCTRDKCPISNTGLSLRRNAVYQLKYNTCDQHYIGSTTRFIHDQVREHISNENSSVKKTYLFLREQRLQRHWYQDYYERKRPPLIFASLKHFTLESASLHSIPEKNVLNSQTFYFSILF